MIIYCVIEHQQGQVRQGSLEALSTARRLKATGACEEIVAIVPGQVEQPEDLGRYGADRVQQLKALEGAYSSDGWAAGLAGACGDSHEALVMLSASARGRDLAPRLAARLGLTQLSECTELDFSEGSLRLTRPVFAGKVLLKTRLQSSALLTLRPKVFEAEEAGEAAPVETLEGEAPEMKAVVAEIIGAASAKLDLTEADIIVSGGRGVGGPEGYAPLEALAEKLGAVVGASRASVDAGWRPHSDQVGQTGKVVNPTLYIACGISGAIQHLAGMKNSRYIVAINKDPEAPIFKVADYGIVGDLFQVIPALTEAV